ncbi:hypothetical protein ABPG72_008235 [Tetrahymena utriculariae]
MDKYDCNQFINCVIHQNKKAKFKKINQIDKNRKQNPFYCSDCFKEDLQFQGINYLLFSQIIHQNDKNNILQKWPPVNDYQIIEKLIQETQNQDFFQSVILRINKYFIDLKGEILKKLDLCEKNIIMRVLDQPFIKDQIIKQYQKISEISKLKTIVLDIKSLPSQQQQQQYTDFIQKMQSLRDENTKQLQKLLEICSNKNELFNFEYPNTIKQSLISLIDQIDFFNNSNQTQNLGQRPQVTRNSENIYKLISNKSNFCSEQFLQTIKQQLEIINPLFDKISFDNMFDLGKQQIRFGEISQQALVHIDEYVEHLIKLNNDKKYQQQIKSSEQVEQFQSILENNLNFINKELKQKFEDLLINLFPLIKSRDNYQIIEKKEQFQLFSNLLEDQINIIYQIIKKQQEIKLKQNFSKSETKNVILNLNYQFGKFKQNDLNNILEQFPIFDIVPQHQYKSLMNNLQLTKSTFQDGINRIQIYKNYLNKYEIDVYDNYKSNCELESTNLISNLVLQKQKKYVFRVQMQIVEERESYFLIGLMKNKNLHTQVGVSDNLMLALQYKNNQLEFHTKSSISDYLKGNNMKLSTEDFIELRVWLGGKVLQIVDYPNYNYKIKLQEQFTQNLTDFEDLRFFLSLNQNRRYIISDVFEVDEFSD